MALFQPTNITPNTLSGVGAGTVDATKALKISWQVNGNSPLVAYRIKIMQNTTASAVMYDSGKKTLADPFYGTDINGNPVLFTTSVSATTLANDNIVNGYANGYKLTIRQYWDSTHYVDQTSASYFITRATPIAELYTISNQNDFQYQAYLFSANFTQSDGDTWDWSRWQLESFINTGWYLVEDTGPIYGAGQQSGNITDFYYKRVGFSVDVDENSEVWPMTHRIKCTAQTENGVTVDTGWIEFEVTMPDNHIQNELILCKDKDHDAIRIEYPKNFMLQGKDNGDYSYIIANYTERLSLPAGSSVEFGGVYGNGEWVSLAITPDLDYSVRCKMTPTDVSSDYTCLELDYVDYKIYFKFGASGYAVLKDSDTLWSVSTPAVNGAFFEIELGKDHLYWGVNNSGTVTTGEYQLSEWIDGATMDVLTIYGPDVLSGIYIAKPLTYALFQQDMNAQYPMIAYTVAPYFNAVCHGTLFTGGILGADTLTGPTVSVAIFRKEKDIPLLTMIDNNPLKRRIIYDYSAVNGKAYDYFLATMRFDEFNQMLKVQDRYATTPITPPCFWNYTVLCCDPDNYGNYRVTSEYRFALNLESGIVSNNNKPALQENFTQYPVHQFSSSNYKSGTLSALIGKVENDEYVDSVDLMEELYALSVSTKKKFLKTRKGQLFQIEIMNPVSMQISDQYAQQPAKISLPWVEVGDALNANIILLSGDDTWGDDEDPGVG